MQRFIDCCECKRPMDAANNENKKIMAPTPASFRVACWAEDKSNEKRTD